ncbi:MULTISPECIES: hypothetical protein [Actinosynnema]|uniref:hypothetical protein n=1 Tax=Actinosynnema TaxID=40566 RepID=UPI0020A27861|nr:hypothetical protein [Actinosynnema pretiosum]MCP2097160.1 hypothetical protein [Actinosynnema pretiosum]
MKALELLGAFLALNGLLGAGRDLLGFGPGGVISHVPGVAGNELLANALVLVVGVALTAFAHSRLRDGDVR